MVMVMGKSFHKWGWLTDLSLVFRAILYGLRIQVHPYGGSLNPLGQIDDWYHLLHMSWTNRTPSHSTGWLGIVSPYYT